MRNPFDNFTAKLNKIAPNLVVSPTFGFLAAFLMHIEHVLGSLFVSPFFQGVAFSTALSTFGAIFMGGMVISEIARRLQGRPGEISDKLTVLHGLVYAAALHSTYYLMLEAGFTVGAGLVASGVLTTSWHFLASSLSILFEPKRRVSEDLSSLINEEGAHLDADEPAPSPGPRVAPSPSASSSEEADEDLQAQMSVRHSPALTSLRRRSPERNLSEESSRMNLSEEPSSEDGPPSSRTRSQRRF